MLTSWAIPRKHSRCCHQGEQLNPGMDVYSILVENEESYVRSDFCLACWALLQEEKSLPLHQAYWKTKVASQTAHRGTRWTKALTLLFQFLQCPSAYEAEIFVLCLYLAHARQIILRREFEQEGKTYQVYEVLQQKEEFTIQAIHLSATQIATVQQSLAGCLYTSMV